MTNFITALQAATAHTYKGKGKNGAAIKAAAEEGYKSTDLRNPTINAVLPLKPIG
tara:strand:- start:156 stop:320 length:165 start_codon:yes stop_codon:yes gene_type:complete